jgi:hypothetical protein
MVARKRSGTAMQFDALGAEILSCQLIEFFYSDSSELNKKPNPQTNSLIKYTAT